MLFVFALQMTADSTYPVVATTLSEAIVMVAWESLDHVEPAWRDGHTISLNQQGDFDSEAEAIAWTNDARRIMRLAPMDPFERLNAGANPDRQEPYLADVARQIMDLLETAAKLNLKDAAGATVDRHPGVVEFEKLISSGLDEESAKTAVGQKFNVGPRQVRRWINGK